MRIFTDLARFNLRRIITALSSLSDVAETDFLEDDAVIWSECWTQLEIAERTGDRLVPTRIKDEPAITLVGERLLAAFDTFSKTEPIFDPEARKYAAALPRESNPLTRFKTDENGNLLRRGLKADVWDPSNDLDLWRFIVLAAIQEINYSDDHGFWFRLCFKYAEAMGTVPDVLIHPVEEDEEER